MFTNQIIDNIRKTYGVTACTENGDNNYYTIEKIHRCSSECMNVFYTLYIFACSYEDALMKIANIPLYVNFTIQEKGSSIINDNLVTSYYIVCPINSLCVEVVNKNAYTTAEEVNIELVVTED